MKLNRNNIEYIINEKGGTVVAILPPRATEVFYRENLGSIRDTYPTNPLFNGITRKIFKKYKKNTFKGVAKLVPGDVWDVEKGKKIADLKLQIKLKKFLVNFVSELTNEFMHQQWFIIEQIQKENDDILFLEEKLNKFKNSSQKSVN